MWNMLRQGWSGDYRVHGDSATADCVIGFSFGGVRRDGKIQPGPSNEEIAAIIQQRFANRPLILQGEIADALTPSFPATMLYRIGDPEHSGPYLDSRAVAERALALMRQHGWTTAIVVAHPHHVARAVAVCQALGIDTVVPDGLHRVPFCESSMQWWTRGPVRWRLREIPAMVCYALRGWLTPPATGKVDGTRARGRSGSSRD